MSNSKKKYLNTSLEWWALAHAGSLDFFKAWTELWDSYMDVIRSWLGPGLEIWSTNCRNEDQWSVQMEMKAN